MIRYEMLEHEHEAPPKTFQSGWSSLVWKNHEPPNWSSQYVKKHVDSVWYCLFPVLLRLTG